MGRKLSIEGLNELTEEQERSPRTKCSTHEEMPIGEKEMNRRATDLKPIKKIDSMEFNKEKEEAKSKKVLLLMKPSLYAKVKELSEKKGTSVNNAINVMLESLLEAQKG